MGFSVGVDYLGFTVRNVPLDELATRLGTPFSEGKGGFRGYPKSFIATGDQGGTAILGTGAPRNPGEIHADVSGGFLGGWDFARVHALTKWVRDQGGKVTRIDIAFDDRVGVISVAGVRRAIEKGQAVTRFRDMTQIRKVGLEAKGDGQGETVNLGSRVSQTFIRIYDKAKEQQRKGKEVVGPWVRWEVELKDERANAMGQALAALDEDEWRKVAVGVLRSAVDFRQTDWEAEPMDRTRAEPTRWWLRLTEGLKRARLVIGQVVRKIEDVKQWFSESIGPIVAVLKASAKAGQAWLDLVADAGAQRWRAKHHALLETPPPMKEYRLCPI